MNLHLTFPHGEKNSNGRFQLPVLYFRKDVNGFFAYPVNDMIAPGYSIIISHPMDFSTMMTKIDNSEYKNVLDYKVIMC